MVMINPPPPPISTRNRAFYFGTRTHFLHFLNCCLLLSYSFIYWRGNSKRRWHRRRLRSFASHLECIGLLAQWTSGQAFCRLASSAPDPTPSPSRYRHKLPHIAHLRTLGHLTKPICFQSHLDSSLYSDYRRPDLLPMFNVRSYG